MYKMPRPDELRKERLNHLLKWAKDFDIISYDAILKKAIEEYPFVTDKTNIDYAKTVTRIRALTK